MAVRRCLQIFAGASFTLSTVIWAGDAFAHAGDRGHVLLLPTGHYIFGGAIAVALTFLVLALVPARPLDDLARLRLRIGSLPTWPRLAASALCFFLLVGLLVAGWFGSRDPLSNPLPLMVWTVFWVGLTLAQGVFGNIWWWINPWYAPWRILSRVTGRREAPELPGRVGYWPAVALFAAFAWFELVYPAPDDPARLATVLAVYFVLNLFAALTFGYEAWMRQGECLSVFLRMISRLAIVDGSRPVGKRRAIALCLPGAKLADAAPLPLSGVVFLLLALGSVSFDGLMRTFFWLGLNGINPLEFPGRTAVLWISSYGLLLTATILASAFFGAVALAARMSGNRAVADAAGALVWSIIPISMAYHFSHYLAALVINGQYALAALSDPFATGADLLGTVTFNVQAGILMGADGAWLVWNLQAAAIIGGHLLAILVAHVIALRLHGTGGAATRSQLPLAILMVAYTVFGLWLLSSPTAG
ncbi:hypothetical protein [Mesorhizobium sp. CAU 1732]|uniref:hypothetical protein n=1 Tax=Mesorhizobium sp. CAU 1732 TaxID=3140358 RepID=UPI0032619BA9